MTLGRQLAIVASAIFLVALAGVQAIHMLNTQAHLQRQLESLAQDAATSIGLSLGTLLRGADPALAETVINPAFDRGHYERIEFVSAAGKELVRKTLPPAQGRYPAWFAQLFPLYAPTAESLVSAGWTQVGRVKVTVHPRFAYEQLWATARDTMLYLLIIYAAALAALRLFLGGVLRPLAAVERAARQISARNFVTVDVEPGSRELARVVEAMNALSRKVADAIASETQRADRLREAAYRDEVTGLLNRRGFAARFEGRHEAGREPFSGSFGFVEIADLGVLNRELGQARCDALLRGVGQAVEAQLGARGLAGRWSGAVIVMAVPEWGIESAREGLQGLRGRILEALKDFGLTGYDAVSCGAVAAAGAAPGLADLTQAADAALFRAREATDGVVVMPAQPEGDADAVVRDAVAARRIQLVGQAVCAMREDRPLHTELMARLLDGSGQQIAAARFVPVLAAHGLGAQLDRAVIERVLQLAHTRPSAERLSVNLSMRSVEQAGFLEWLALALARDRSLAHRLTFEVSEHGLLQSEPAAVRLTALLARCGAGFALDHFGVHRESLALLHKFRPAYVKLAGTHTTGLLSDAGTRFFVESLVQAARQVDVPAIALNVEDEAALPALQAAGFAGYQGHLRGRPAAWP